MYSAKYIRRAQSVVHQFHAADLSVMARNIAVTLGSWMKWLALDKTGTMLVPLVTNAAVFSRFWAVVARTKTCA